MPFSASTNFSFTFLQVVRVSETIIHPYYVPDELDSGYDIALLVLPEAVHNFPIPSLASPLLTLHNGMTIFTLGWGQSSSTSTTLPDTLKMGSRSTVLQHGTQACKWNDTLFFCLAAEGKDFDNTCLGDC